MAKSFRSLENTIRFGPVREAVHNPKHPKQEKDMNDQVFAGSYRSQHFEVSPDAQRIYSDISKDIDSQKVERAVKQQDQLFGIYKRVLASGYATQQDVDAAERFKKLAQYEVDQYEVKIPHPHIDKIVDMIKQKVKDVPDVVDSITPEQLKKRFDNPPDEYMPSEPMSDKDIDNVKNFHVTRRAATAKKRYLNTGIDEQQTNKGSQEMSFKQLPPKLVESVKNLLEKKHNKSEETTFPNLNRDGKITFADVLKGKKEGEKADKKGKHVAEATGVDPKAIDPHNCATHVYSEQYGNGQCLYSQHDDPDDQGNIKWYDVMFDHGIVRCMTEDLTILETEEHKEKHNHKRKKPKRMNESEQLDEVVKKNAVDVDNMSPRQIRLMMQKGVSGALAKKLRARMQQLQTQPKPTKRDAVAPTKKPEPAKEEMSANDQILKKYGQQKGMVTQLLYLTKQHNLEHNLIMDWLLRDRTTPQHVSDALKNPRALVTKLKTAAEIMKKRKQK